MERLDKYCYEIGLYTSREKAKQGILNHEVLVNKEIIDLPKHLVNEFDLVEKVKENKEYVCRAAYKLIGAFENFHLNITDFACLDIGASTGGFTQVLLENGACSVCALDVGHDQLVSFLREDERVEVIERCNFRYAEPSMFSKKFDFFTSDVSFISLKHIIPKINPLLKEHASGVLLIKPQFEAGKENVNKHGVVTSKDIHKKIIYDIISCANEYGFYILGLSKSPITGKDGNIEYLLYLDNYSKNQPIDIEKIIL